MSAVLLVGSGGREHALGWKLARSPKVSRLIVAPGNDGYPESWERWAVDISKPSEYAGLADRAVSAGVALAVIGPDNPLASGIVDVFESKGLLCFGPGAAAARIEASKSFAKDVMRSAGVPTARFFVTENLKDAETILESLTWTPEDPETGWVVKADGLAFGKGVKVCGTFEEAVKAAHELYEISGSLVIEERLRGTELSWMAFCDGTRSALLEPAQDYKRLLDGDQGPNTGGMGAYSPVLDIPKGMAERVRNEVFLPTLRELRLRGVPFKGLLYAGLMVDFASGKLWVIEFNSRFGDPEAQVLLPRFEDETRGGDLFEWCEATARGDLGALPATVPFQKRAAVVVVCAAAGYPERPEKGQPIEISPTDAGPVPPYFYAGVTRRGGQLYTSGGRVLGALGTGLDLDLAREEAYHRAGAVRFAGMQARADIAVGITEKEGA